ncbi:MAG: 5-methyltetrahydropteroyltriglutamate--homocysteine S-methyltransferase [Alphaproteobacteria bacterium]|nr:5-methyltetrahydropteroyltriglutamate--homocysteine S-methyltransferase [Alphaproteobacteria bacterium]
MRNPGGPPYRADHVGSLLRPAALREVRASAEKGRIAAAELRAAEDSAIRDAVALQERAGLQSITDGEFRRGHYLVDFMSALDGIVPTHTSYALSFRGSDGTTGETRSMLSVSGKVRRSRPIMLDTFRFLKSVTSRTAKVCIPSPTWVHMRGGSKTVSPEAYPDIDEFWDDIVRAFHEEISDLAAAGCTYLQLDEISFAFLCDQTIRDRIAADGLNADRLIADYARVVDRIAAGAPEGMTVTVHTCRGNFQSMWMAEGGYDRVAAKAFAQPSVDGYFLEFDTERAGGFEPLQAIPRDKRVVLGIVSSKNSELENKDDLKRRIDEAAKYFPLEQLCLSPQCGFASTHHGNRITEDVERRKLELIVETATEVWGSAV